AEHAIAGGHVRDALAELIDDARRLVAQSLRELPIHQAPALLPVARVDAGRAHRNPDLAGTRMRIGEIHDLQDLRPPEPAEEGCLHHSLRSGSRVSRWLRVGQSASLAGRAGPGPGPAPARPGWRPAGRRSAGA